MFRILRAFAWMRWRVLVNSLERTASRDTLQRLSLAIEHIGPILAGALFLPSAAGLSALAVYAGYQTATAGNEIILPLEVLRFVLLAGVALCLVGPLVLPATERTNAVRLLLLPIPRATLYLAQASSALADPWVLLAIPIVLLLPVGLAAGGAHLAALVSLLAGLLLLVVLIGIATVTALLLHLVMRDRRRGELLALAFVVILPLVTILSGALLNDDDRRPTRSESESEIEAIPTWVKAAGERAFELVPSELFRDAVLRSVRDAPAGALVPLALLAVGGLALHGAGLAASSRILDSPASTGPRRAGRRGVSWGQRLPGLSPGASAVAVNQLRLAMRTPRGRSILLSPILIFVVMLVVMQSVGDANLGFLKVTNGLSLAVLSTAVSLLSVLPFAMNQFAIDRAGLTLQFLSPLNDRDLVVGKAVGNGIVAGAPALLAMVVAFLAFPGGHPALWLCLPLGFLGTYAAAAPAAAILSALFPRTVDLNSVSSRSNAHGLAGLLGMLVVAAAGAPAALIATAALAVERPSLAPLLLLGWCAVSLLVFRLLLPFATRMVGQRRENLALVA